MTTDRHDPHDRHKVITMDTLIVLLVSAALIALLDVAAARFGAESRESFVDPRSRVA